MAILPRTAHRVIVKIGGSHAADRVRIEAIIRELSASPVRAVIVPGGGEFANAVRDMQGALRFSDRLAHKLAIEAMVHFAEVLVELFPGLVLAENRNEIDAIHNAGRIPVWSAARLTSGFPGVPENWSMTSDSFAALLGFELDAAALLLIKSVDGPASATPDELTSAGITDAAFPEFAARLACPIRLVGPSAIDGLGQLLAFPHSKTGTIVEKGMGT